MVGRSQLVLHNVTSGNRQAWANGVGSSRLPGSRRPWPWS
jgi:hypothetical protein